MFKELMPLNGGHYRNVCTYLTPLNEGNNREIAPVERRSLSI